MSVNRESETATDDWLTDVFAEARDEVAVLSPAAVDALVARLDLRRRRRRWSTLRLSVAMGLAALVAGGATFASYHSWDRSTVSPQQLRQKAQITVGFLPTPGGRLQRDTLVIDLKPTGQTCIYRYWEGLLIAASYKPPAGVHVPKFRINVGCDGSSGGFRNTRGEGLPTPSIAAATQRILAGLKAQGLTPVRLTFIHTEPGHLAVAVIAQTDDPQRYPLGRRGETSRAVIGDPRQFDGHDLRLIDSHHRTVWETAYSSRLMEGLGGPGRAYRR